MFFISINVCWLALKNFKLRQNFSLFRPLLRKVDFQCFKFGLLSFDSISGWENFNCKVFLYYYIKIFLFFHTGFRVVTFGCDFGLAVAQILDLDRNGIQLDPCKILVHSWIQSLLKSVQAILYYLFYILNDPYTLL